jgi:hypothetical protein
LILRFARTPVNFLPRVLLRHTAISLLLLRLSCIYGEVLAKPNFRYYAACVL